MMRQSYQLYCHIMILKTPCLPTLLTKDFAKEPEASTTWKYTYNLALWGVLINIQRGLVVLYDGTAETCFVPFDCLNKNHV